jgi:hypothetical protein
MRFAPDRPAECDEAAADPDSGTPDRSSGSIGGSLGVAKPVSEGLAAQGGLVLVDDRSLGGEFGRVHGVPPFHSRGGRPSGRSA